MRYRSKLIVLRGNSGSGKSTVARAVRAAANGKVALVEQDYLRRTILREKETEGSLNLALIQQTVEFALSYDYDVILEGGLYFPRYGVMLRQLAEACPNNYFYYFDISLDETLRRHATKPNAHEFGEAEMRLWYKPNQQTHFPSERIIPERSSLAETVAAILEHTAL